MPSATVNELVAEARDHLANNAVESAIDSLAEAVQMVGEIAVAAAQRAGVLQDVEIP